MLGALSDGRRLVTVTGPGGVGKSRLLADVGAALATDHDVVHVALSGHQAGDAQDLAAALAVTTGVPLAADDSVASLVRALQTSDVVVLVDEAEWVLGPAAELTRAVLAGCPGVRLVVTSRVPLSVVGERVLPLGPLPVRDAVRLLTERLADRGVPTSGTAERTVLAEVARRVDGLPLALELVAGRAGAVPVRDLLDVVEHPLDLESDEVGRDARQQSLRRTIAWSVDRLEPAGRERPAPARRLRRRLPPPGGPRAHRLHGGRDRTRGGRPRGVPPGCRRADRCRRGVPDAADRARPGPRGARHLRCAGRDPRPARGVVRRAVAGRAAVRRAGRARRAHVRRPPRGPRLPPGDGTDRLRRRRRAGAEPSVAVRGERRARPDLDRAAAGARRDDRAAAGAAAGRPGGVPARHRLVARRAPADRGGAGRRPRLGLPAGAGGGHHGVRRSATWTAR